MQRKIICTSINDGRESHHGRMTFFARKYRITSARKPGQDYRAPGCYFVTICTKDRQPWFGEIRNGIIRLNDVGCIVAEIWQRNAIVYNNVALDRWIIMPDHVHGIIRITHTENSPNELLPPFVTDTAAILNNVLLVETPSDGVSTMQTNGVSTMQIQNRMSRIINWNLRHHPQWQSGCLGSIIQQFKATCTKRIRAIGYEEFAWQSRFHDRIIRNQIMLDAIRSYISNNPLQWESEDNDLKIFPFPL